MFKIISFYDIPMANDSAKRAMTKLRNSLRSVRRNALAQNSAMISKSVPQSGYIQDIIVKPAESFSVADAHYGGPPGAARSKP